MLNRRFWLGLLLVIALLSTSPLSADFVFDEVIDSPMYSSPILPTMPKTKVYPEQLPGLWIKALERPEAAFRFQAAMTIAEAQRQGMPGLQKLIPNLVKTLQKAEKEPLVQLAIVEALLELDARQHAADLAELTNIGQRDLQLRIEPMLARWKYQPMASTWLARLRDPATGQLEVLLAMDGLAQLEIPAAKDLLIERLNSKEMPSIIRLRAAKALGQWQTKGLEKVAEKLLENPSRREQFRRLAAVELLQRHDSAQAIKILQQLLNDKESAIVAAALRRLDELDAKYAREKCQRLVSHSDALLRQLALTNLAQSPTTEHLRLLVGGLSDKHRNVRRKARFLLESLAKVEKTKQQITDIVMSKWSNDSWEGLEQAMILLATLDHDPVAPRLLPLLSHERPEVFVTAAWALRTLDVTDTCAATEKFVDAEFQRLKKQEKLPGRDSVSFAIIDHQLSQLNQFLGKQKFIVAADTLEKFVPRQGEAPVGNESRAAAIWALGMIYAGKGNPRLVSSFETRLNDVNSLPMEDDRVRWMSAIAIGRLKGKEALPSLQMHCSEFKVIDDPVNNACGWSIQILTGKLMPPPEPRRLVQRSWFLTPSVD